MKQNRKEGLCSLATCLFLLLLGYLSFFEGKI